MNKNKLLILIALLILCICVSISSVSAIENSTNDLELIDQSNPSYNLNTMENIDSFDNLSETNSNLILEIENNYNSTETLSVSTNQSDEVLSSYVSVSNGHTYHKGGYTFTLSNKVYNQIKNHKIHYTHVKTNGHKTLKIPVYKNMRVIGYKWAYKNVLTCSDYYDKYGNLLKYKRNNDISHHLKNGWRYYTSFFKNGHYGRDGIVTRYYSQLIKKVPYNTIKKVKIGTKKIKLPIMAQVGLSGGKNNQLYAHYYVGDYSRYRAYESIGWYYFNG